MSALRAHFTAAAPAAVSRGFQRATGYLLLLATLSAFVDQRAPLALWAFGRPAALASLPYALVALLTCCALAMTADYRARSAGVLACGAMASLNALLPFAYHNNHYLLFLFVALVSLGSLWPTTLWTPRMLQLQLATVYLGSALVKLFHPWWSGTGSVLVWAVDHHAPASSGWVNDVARALLSVPYAAQLTDTAVTATEAALPLLLFSARGRRAGIAIAIAMHVAMQEWLFPQMFTFLMLLGLHAFTALDGPAWRVAYDPGRRFDRQLRALYARADLFARTEWTPGPSLALRTPAGLVLSRADTLRTLVLLSPLSVLGYATFALCLPHIRRVENTLAVMALIALLPLVRWISQRAVSLPP